MPAPFHPGGGQHYPIPCFAMADQVKCKTTNCSDQIGQSHVVLKPLCFVEFGVSHNDDQPMSQAAHFDQTDSLCSSKESCQPRGEGAEVRPGFFLDPPPLTPCRPAWVAGSHFWGARAKKKLKMAKCFQEEWLLISQKWWKFFWDV